MRTTYLGGGGNTADETIAGTSECSLLNSSPLRQAPYSLGPQRAVPACGAPRPPLALPASAAHWVRPRRRAIGTRAALCLARAPPPSHGQSFIATGVFCLADLTRTSTCPTCDQRNAAPAAEKRGDTRCGARLGGTDTLNLLKCNDFKR